MLWGRREGKRYGSSSVDQGEQLPGLQAQEQVEMWPPPGGAVGMASSGRARICLGQEGEESEEVVPAQSTAVLASRGRAATTMTVFITPIIMFLFSHNQQVLTSILLDFDVLIPSAV